MKESKPSKLRKSQLDKLLGGFGISKKNAKLSSNLPDNVVDGFEVVTFYGSSRRLKSLTRMEYIKTLTEFEYFSTGEFLADVDRKRYQDFIEEIIYSAKNIFPEYSEHINNQPVNLVLLFSQLYNFRLRVNHLFQYSLGTRMRQEFSIEDDYFFSFKK